MVGCLFVCVCYVENGGGGLVEKRGGGDVVKFTRLCYSGVAWSFDGKLTTRLSWALVRASDWLRQPH